MGCWLKPAIYLGQNKCAEHAGKKVCNKTGIFGSVKTSSETLRTHSSGCLIAQQGKFINTILFPAVISPAALKC